ncbi:MAG: papain-like cysteine protease family protein [Minisyncoccia bacterium]|jgi:predicted double-glycine peptidase
MLNVKPFRQTAGMCGPATLKMVLEFFGVEKSEEELAELTHCDPEKGITGEVIVRAAETLGFKGMIKDFAEFEDIKNYLDKKIPVIVDWFSEFENNYDGHYSIVIGLDNDKIILQDPEVGGTREFPLELFKRIWFDFKNDFIVSKDDMIIRRMIVIYK